MNPLLILKDIETLRSALEGWHLTPMKLGLAALTASVVGAFALREMLGWFLRTNELRRDLKALRADVASLRGYLETSTATPAEEPEERLFALDQRRKSL